MYACMYMYVYIYMKSVLNYFDKNVFLFPDICPVFHFKINSKMYFFHTQTRRKRKKKCSINKKIVVNECHLLALF